MYKNKNKKCNCLTKLTNCEKKNVTDKNKVASHK